MIIKLLRLFESNWQFIYFKVICAFHVSYRAHWHNPVYNFCVSSFIMLVGSVVMFSFPLQEVVTYILYPLIFTILAWGLSIEKEKDSAFSLLGSCFLLDQFLLSLQTSLLLAQFVHRVQITNLWFGVLLISVSDVINFHLRKNLPVSFHLHLSYIYWIKWAYDS